MQCKQFKIIMQILAIIFSIYGTAYAKEQMITLLSSSEVALSEGDLVTITVQYNTSDANQMLSSLGVRIHYDSSKLEYLRFDQMFIKDTLVESPFPQDESIEQSDDDPTTDKIFLLSYASMNGEWPGTYYIDESVSPPVVETISLPLSLIRLVFKAKGNTTMNVSRVTGDNAYGFQASRTEILVHPKKWELKDVLSLLKILSKHE
ncbi:conserved hypothetical protein, secreted [Candidatus Magnetomorum sp. HK-1]|nr:conserved hypothetical protein, secreted [Candidatus Magnetomorum sp. HK-1]